MNFENMISIYMFIFYSLISSFIIEVKGIFQVENGYLLNCMHKQQDFFGCLAEILGCLGLREAANLEI